MVTTLEALHQAVIANPADRTVRLVYADALDETGDPSDAARAEFIRAQIEVEPVAVADTRPLTPYSRAFDLFDEHWLEWWRPVAEAVGLPDPHVPGRRVRDVFSPRTRRRRRRHKNWPYTHSPDQTTVHLADYGIAVRFVAGFPEEVQFLAPGDNDNTAELEHRWGDAMPVRKCVFSRLELDQWGRIGGPHLSRVSDASFDNLSPELATALANSPELSALTDLSVGPTPGGSDGIVPLVTRPPWENLRALRITSRVLPAPVRDLALRCTLVHLEELDLAIGNPGALGALLMNTLGQLVRRIMQTSLLPAPPELRWTEYGPAFEALAAAPWVRRLRRLRITTGAGDQLLQVLGERLYGAAEEPAALIPDRPVLTLADAVNTDKLESLVLPATAVSPSVRETLKSRLGPRVAFS